MPPYLADDDQPPPIPLFHDYSFQLYLVQLSDPFYDEVHNNPQLLQYDEVPPPVPPYLADDDQPPPIPLFHGGDESPTPEKNEAYGIIKGSDHYSPIKVTENAAYCTVKQQLSLNTPPVYEKIN